MKVRRLILVIAAAVGHYAAATPALALPTTILIAPSFVLSGGLQDPCVQPALSSKLSAGRQALTSQSKSSAILGGQASKLELIARQQSQTQMQQVVKATIPGPGQSDITPGSGGRCHNFVVRPPTGQVGLGMRGTGPDDFLGSKRLTVKRTSFDGAWNRVRGGSLSRKLLPRLQAEKGVKTLAAVNSWTNDNVRYVDDRVLYGQADYWASAANTLQRRAGDCEDIAIAKMQLLAQMGVPRSDMYLTVARDTVRNADHAMLVVKMDGTHWLLDNATNQLLDAEQSYDYRPIMSFSTSRKWLHGY